MHFLCHFELELELELALESVLELLWRVANAELLAVIIEDACCMR
jgi:hypothetical protein